MKAIIGKFSIWALLFAGFVTIYCGTRVSAQDYAVVTSDNGYVVNANDEVEYKVPYFSLIKFDGVQDSKLLISGFDGKYGIRLGQVFVILELSKDNVNRPLNANDQQVMRNAIVGMRDAFALSDEGKYAKAIKKGDEAAATLGLLFFADPQPSPYQVWFEAQIAYFEYASGDLAAANKRLDYAESILKSVRQKNPVQASDLYNVRGLVRTAEGRQKEAIALFEKAIAITKNTFGENHMDIASIMQNLSVAQEELGELEKALQTQNDAMGLIDALIPAGTVELPAAYSRLGNLLLANEKTDHALKAYEIALRSFMENNLDDDLVETANARLGFHDAMVALGNNELAGVALDVGLRNEVGKMKGDDAAQFKKAFYYRHGVLDYEQDKMKEALNWLEKAGKLHDRDNEDSVDALIMSTIGHIHAYNSDSAKAKKAYEQAVQIYIRLEGEESESAAEVRGWIAN